MANICLNKMTLTGDKEEIVRFREEHVVPGFTFSRICPEDQWETVLDAHEVETLVDRKDRLQLLFETKEFPPLGVARAIARQYPRLFIDLGYCEPGNQNAGLFAVGYEDPDELDVGEPCFTEEHDQDYEAAIFAMDQKPDPEMDGGVYRANFYARPEEVVIGAADWDDAVDILARHHGMAEQDMRERIYSFDLITDGLSRLDWDDMTIDEQEAVGRCTGLGLIAQGLPEMIDWVAEHPKAQELLGELWERNASSSILPAELESKLESYLVELNDKALIESAPSREGAAPQGSTL